MILSTFFTNNGTPATGLTATIDVWTSAGTQVITASAMTEIAGGFYQYDFTAYDPTLDYFIRADGSASLNLNERYIASTNQGMSELDHILGLVQSNFSMTGQTYDSDGNMTAASISIYPTAADTAAETNAIASYSVVGVYTAGLLTDYKVTID